MEDGGTDCEDTVTVIGKGTQNLTCSVFLVYEINEFKHTFLNVICSQLPHKWDFITVILNPRNPADTDMNTRYTQFQASAAV